MEIAQFDRWQHTISYWRRIATTAPSPNVSKIKRELVENHDLFITHLYLTSPFRGILSEFRHNISCGKLERWGYQKVEMFEGIGVSRQDTVVTDSRTDTAPWHRPRLCTAAKMRLVTGTTWRAHSALQYRDGTNSHTDRQLGRRTMTRPASEKLDQWLTNNELPAALNHRIVGQFGAYEMTYGTTFRCVVDMGWKEEGRLFGCLKCIIIIIINIIVQELHNKYKQKRKAKNRNTACTGLYLNSVHHCSILDYLTPSALALLLFAPLQLDVMY